MFHKTLLNPQHRILVVNGSMRNDTRNLCLLAQGVLEEKGVLADVLDLAHAEALAGRWEQAHGVIIVTPAYRHQEPPLLKLARLPAQLAERAYGVVVHGPADATASTRSALTTWLDDMGMVDASPFARLDRYVGYADPCMDGGDFDVEEEVRNVAHAVASCVTELRAGRLSTPLPWVRRVPEVRFSAS